MVHAAAPADLREPSVDPWSRLHVPAGWEPVAAVAREVADDLPQLAGHILRCIAREIPAYRTADAVPAEDVHASVVRNLDAMLVGLAERRGPRDDEVVVRRELGTRRAAQGVPIEALIQAYHVGYRELWKALVGRVPDTDPETATQLLGAATTVWQWVHEVTDGIARAHAEAVRGQEAHVAGARQRFAELVATGDLTRDEVHQLAIAIGFQPDGEYTATVARPEALAGSETGHLQRLLDRRGGSHAVVQRGPVVVVLSQDLPADEVLAAVREVLPDAAIGVGIERRGLVGARTSLGDADRAAALSSGEPVRFDDEWLWATVLRARPRLEVLLRPGIRAAAEHPHLAETVRAFAEVGFSVSEAARQLSLHANTVAYRLERWHRVTGWDPRTLPGLTRSLAATLLSERR